MIEVVIIPMAIFVAGLALGWVARGHVHDIVDKAIAAFKGTADKAASV